MARSRLRNKKTRFLLEPGKPALTRKEESPCQFSILYGKDRFKFAVNGLTALLLMVYVDLFSLLFVL